MEKREVLTVIIAAVGICMLIGIIRMVTGADMQDESSSKKDPTVSAPAVMTEVTTDYWDVIRAEQNSGLSADFSDGSSTETTESDPSAIIETQNSMSLITEYEFTSTTSTVFGIGDVEVPGFDLDPFAQQTTAAVTAAETTTTTTTATTEFVIVVP